MTSRLPFAPSRLPFTPRTTPFAPPINRAPQAAISRAAPSHRRQFRPFPTRRADPKTRPLRAPSRPSWIVHPPLSDKTRRPENAPPSCPFVSFVDRPAPPFPAQPRNRPLPCRKSRSDAPPTPARAAAAANFDPFPAGNLPFRATICDYLTPPPRPSPTKRGRLKTRRFATLRRSSFFGRPRLRCPVSRADSDAFALGQ